MGNSINQIWLLCRVHRPQSCHAAHSLVSRGSRWRACPAHGPLDLHWEVSIAVISNIFNNLSSDYMSKSLWARSQVRSAY
jgi:hypothetical protein